MNNVLMTNDYFMLFQYYMYIHSYNATAFKICEIIRFICEVLKFQTSFGICAYTIPPPPPPPPIPYRAVYTYILKLLYKF
jgi:hypothetical protein